MKKLSRLWKKTEDGLPLVFIDYDFVAKANLKCKTTKNNVINSYKGDYFFDNVPFLGAKVKIICQFAN